MNINDITDIVIPEDRNYIKGIFDRQTELHKKYSYIEERNGIGLGIVKGIPFDINDARWQYVLKDYFWRVTEELCECAEAHHEQDEIHAVEEAIDALHFYTEILVIMKFSHEEIAFMASEFEILFNDVFTIIYMMGLSANCLKQKPWKNSPFLTDLNKFEQNLIGGYQFFLNWILHVFNLDLETLYIFYYKKSEVNNFRIRSNY